MIPVYLFKILIYYDIVEIDFSINKYQEIIENAKFILLNEDNDFIRKNPIRLHFFSKPIMLPDLYKNLFISPLSFFHRC